MTTAEFTATLEPRPGGGVEVRLPFDPTGRWGARERYHLRGSIHGVMVRGPLTCDEGVWALQLGPKWVESCAANPGDSVQVVLELESPHSGTVGDDFAAALRAEPDALAFFDGLPTFYRKNFVRRVDGSKKPETRARNIALVIEALRNRKDRL